MNLISENAVRLSGKFAQTALVMLVFVVFVSSAAAEQIRILDAQGNTRSMAELAAGSSATLKISLKGSETSSASGASVLLQQAETKSTLQTTAANARGVAQFSNVQAGDYTIETADAQLSISDIQVIKTQSKANQQTKLPEEQTREIGRAMYVAGASAVAGVVGITAAGSDSGSSGSSSVGFINTPRVVGTKPGLRKPLPRGGVAKPRVKPRQAFDDTPPDSTPVSPPPGEDDTTDEGTPPVWDDEGNPNGDDPDPAPSPTGTPAPAPDPIDPMTPS